MARVVQHRSSIVLRSPQSTSYRRLARCDLAAHTLPRPEIKVEPEQDVRGRLRNRTARVGHTLRLVRVRVRVRARVGVRLMVRGKGEGKGHG